ncbi:MAG: SHOCT domain-containing protein [Chloroflexi bacterium]|nr:SHOCT domain-containing protein [Chloroflexota bacterium]
MDWGDGGFVVMWITMAVFWFGVLALGAWGVATYAKRGGEAGPSALEIARARYARGEITAEEFEQIKQGLR